MTGSPGTEDKPSKGPQLGMCILFHEGQDLPTETELQVLIKPPHGTYSLLTKLKVNTDNYFKQYRTPGVLNYSPETEVKDEFM